MTGHLTTADVARMHRGTGMTELPTEQALAAFDTALRARADTLVPVRFSQQALRTVALDGTIPPLLSHLATEADPSAPTARGSVDGAETDSLAQRLPGLSHAGQQRELLGLVRTHVALVLGHSNPDPIKPDATFLSLGCDSLAGMELRNRLAAATGLRLPATIVYNHPTPDALAGYLRTRLVPTEPEPGADTSTTDTSTDQRSSFVVSRIYAATNEELFRLIDETLGA